MRLKSKYVVLVALITLTATPRALDQLTDLKNQAQDRFRAELLNIFWNFTTPESRRDSARQNAEFLARMQAAAPVCPLAEAAARERVVRGLNRSARSNTNAVALKPRQPSTFEWSSDNHIAAAQANQASDFIMMDEQAAPAKVSSLSGAWLSNEWRQVLPVAANLKGRAPFAEVAKTPRIDEAIARLDVEREALAEALPAPRPRMSSPRELTAARAFAQKFVQTNFQTQLSNNQIQLPENFEILLTDKALNSDTLIKIHEALSPAKTKCRVRVLRIAPEAPRPLEKPAIVS
ncbi:MAG: hypothetical protein QOF02_3864 [Blastocatellia bacterium]|jgi:hypothetical protein|nr:hypothetical protein [Blastocatellia bacterium]